MTAPVKLFAVALTAGALAFAGCGGSNDNTSSDNSDSANTGTATEQPAENNTANSGQGNNAGMIDVAADPDGQPAFVPDKLGGKAGKVEVDFTNDSAVPHSIVIDAPDGQEVAKTPVFTGGSEKASFDAKPGAYTFYCSVPGHREGGMEGTLTIK